MAHNDSRYGVGFLRINNDKFKIMITKESLREEYETETGKKHGNALFSTTDYACWLEKRLVKNCSIPDVVGQSEQLKAEVFKLANKLAVAGEGDAAVAMHGIHNRL